MAVALASGSMLAAPVADTTQVQRPALVATAGKQRDTKRANLLPSDLDFGYPRLILASPSFPQSRPPIGALAIRRSARKRRNVACNKAHHRHARGRRS